MQDFFHQQYVHKSVDLVAICLISSSSQSFQAHVQFPPSWNNTILLESCHSSNHTLLFLLSLEAPIQGGPLLVADRVITLINGLIYGQLESLHPKKVEIQPYLQLIGAHLVSKNNYFAGHTTIGTIRFFFQNTTTLRINYGISSHWWRLEIQPRTLPVVSQPESTWRIIPVRKWLVTPIYKPFRPFRRGITPVRGLTNHGY